MEISINHFEQLTKIQLYSILQLRQRVFIQEQQSIYDDIDGEDLTAMHVLLMKDDVIQGYARFRRVEQDSKALIERVVLAPEIRGSGAGHRIMEAILVYCRRYFQGAVIQLSAQVDVLAFYERLGFVAKGQPYDDGGILHKTMVLKD